MKIMCHTIISKGTGEIRVATAQGRQSIWLSNFPDREKTGNLRNLRKHGKFGQHREKVDYF